MDLLELRVGFQVAISADSPSQAPLNSRSLRYVWASGLLPTASPQELAFLFVDWEPLPELPTSPTSVPMADVNSFFAVDPHQGIFFH